MIKYVFENNSHLPSARVEVARNITKIYLSELTLEGTLSGSEPAEARGLSTAEKKRLERNTGVNIENLPLLERFTDNHYGSRELSEVPEGMQVVVNSEGAPIGVTKAMAGTILIAHRRNSRSVEGYDGLCQVSVVFATDDVRKKARLTHLPIVEHLGDLYKGEPVFF